MTTIECLQGQKIKILLPDNSVLEVDTSWLTVTVTHFPKDDNIPMEQFTSVLSPTGMINK